LPEAGRQGKDAALVQAMFDRVAPRYDLANAILSLGQDAHWRRVTAAGALPSAAVCLDVASGPGNVAQALLAAGAERVIALDLSLGMLRVGVRRGLPDVDWVQGTALQLPLADASVDVVTISFGLRNVPDAETALDEFARVLRPGGRLVIAEFAAPTWAPFRTLYSEYLMRLLPRVAELVSSDGRSYRYLAESILAWPDRATLAGWLTTAGFLDVRVKDLSGGIVALHRGIRTG
jgi:demethylmenaquinone methyltransferase/2-methoxy-6-polyprenyl-1,4-benzoquinol methylase